ncbi:hypothetical protein D3Y59_05080 [Hymenobacter oligotrophus]|uniref:Peptidase A2 domain-containing protein n=1 Tax=Hymenobacter oligotrophus TaxID=2319843 RepID=A0A3B7QYL6_9BACT|nr:hypothetical protein [Hymenobacter oligotrophus]AYA36482.1 hypothetical protein D3Y59_05080 [Hymenobacter oligotrophus]
MKTLRTALLLLTLLLLASGGAGYLYFRSKFEPGANQLAVTGLPASCTFVWRADSSAKPVAAHAYQLVPVRLPGCARTCYLQFDTGAPYTVLYQHPLAALRARYPATRRALLLQADSVRNFRFALGDGQVLARRLPVLRYGARALPPDSTQPFIIGTLGADVLEGRVLVVDYARQRFSLLPRTPDSLARRADFVPLAFDSRRVLLNAGLRSENSKLLFDTGTSAFALLTSQSRWQQLAQPAAPVQTRAVSSWGKTLTAYTAPTLARLHLGPAALPLGTVTYIEGTSWWQSALMRFSGMGGMLGNEPFAGRTIILDVQGQRFGVVRR